MTSIALKDLAELLPEALLVVDPSGAVLECSRRAAELLGRSPVEVAGHSLALFVAGGHSALDPVLRMGARSRSLLPAALNLLQPDGSVEECRCETGLLQPKSEGRGPLILLRLQRKTAAATHFLVLNERIDALSREVVRRKALESELREYAERLRVTLASIGDGMIATDAQGRVTMMNAVAEAMTGWSEGDARGRPVEEVFSIVNQHSRLPVENPVAKVLREGTIVGLANHTVLIGRDGVERAIDDSGAPIRSERGGLLGVVLIFRDISERYAMESELRRQSELLAEAGRRKDEFLSMLAHELRNPLAPMSTALYLLLAGRLDPGKSVAMLQMMKRQVTHMTRLVDDLLDVARLTSGRIELQTSRVRLDGILQQALDMVRPGIDAKQLQVELGPIPESLVIDADPVRLVQVFTNLLSNASKFTPARGHIAVLSHVDHDEVVVSVCDDGAGIEPEVLPHVFDFFVQGRQSLDRSQGGLGVGLSVVQALVRLHGGRVEAHSGGLGLGARFVVRLPLSDLPAPASASLPDEATVAPGRAWRVLVVEDNEDAAQGLGAVLSLWGHEVRTVGEGQAALDLWAQFQPHVVLLDVGLPGMSGYEIARKLRERPDAQDAFIVAVSGYGQQLDREQSRIAGMNEHLTKPVDLDRLGQMLREPIGRLSR